MQSEQAGQKSYLNLRWSLISLWWVYIMWFLTIAKTRFDDPGIASIQAKDMQ